MKITRVDYSKLRNNEHFQCHIEARDLITQVTPKVLKIEELFLSYKTAIEAEDEALIKIMKNSYTEARGEKDRSRDGIFRGMADVAKSALNHFDQPIVAAAKRLKILFDTYGNIAKLPLNEETSAIHNLLQELRGNYAAESKLVGIDVWADKLDAENAEFVALTRSGYDETAARTELKVKATRAETDRVFRAIVERIEALVVVEGEADYAEFIRRLNVQLKTYK